MSDSTNPPAIEDLFDAEARLRIKARDYSSAEHGATSVEIRRNAARELRAAAKHFGRLSDAFDAAMAKASKEGP